MIENINKDNKMRLLYWIIALLVLLLIFQNLLLFKLNINVSGDTPIKTKTENNVRRFPNSTGMHQHHQRRSIKNALSYPTQSNTLVATDPLEEFQSAMSQMNRIFNQAMAYSTPMMHALSDNAVQDFVPAIDLQETEKAYVLSGDLPGLQKDKINISVHGFTVTIEGIREIETKNQDASRGFFSQERSYGSFARSITLPSPIDEANVKADYRDGVLTIILPKIATLQNKQKVDIT